MYRIIVIVYKILQILKYWRKQIKEFWGNTVLNRHKYTICVRIETLLKNSFSVLVHFIRKLFTRVIRTLTRERWLITLHRHRLFGLVYPEIQHGRTRQESPLLKTSVEIYFSHSKTLPIILNCLSSLTLVSLTKKDSWWTYVLDKVSTSLSFITFVLSMLNLRVGNGTHWWFGVEGVAVIPLLVSSFVKISINTLHENTDVLITTKIMVMLTTIR